MALDFRFQRYQFGPHTGSSQQKKVTFAFPSLIRHAIPTIAGFSIGYTGSDHHLGREQIETAVDINGSSVDVFVTFLLRDSSGDIDDAFDGFVDIQLLVDRL